MTCSLLTTLIIGNAPFPRCSLLPFGRTHTTSPFSIHAYTFLPFTDSIEQLRPSPISISGFPGSQANILLCLRQTVWGSFLALITIAPPSIGQPFKGQLPFPSFSALPKWLPPSEDRIRYKSLFPCSQLRNITDTLFPFTATDGLQHSQTEESGELYINMFLDQFLPPSFDFAPTILLRFLPLRSSHTAKRFLPSPLKAISPSLAT